MLFTSRLFRATLALATLSTIACSSSGNDDASSDDALGASNCPAAEGKLTIYFIPPSTHIDWSTPNRMTATILKSQVTEEKLVLERAAKKSHLVGHTHVKLDCGSLSIPLTGQTGGGEFIDSAKQTFDGFGSMLRDAPGRLNEFPGPENDATIEDVQRREASGHIVRMSFDVNHAMCQRLYDYHEAYLQHHAYEHFAGATRARRFEGAGCAGFGMSFVEVGGLARRSLFTPLWAQSVMIGSARFGNFLDTARSTSGSDFPYGSNLQAKLPDGRVVSWPKGMSVKTPKLRPIIPGRDMLDSWTGPEDREFDLPDGAPPEVQTALPITIYDPMLGADFVEKVWNVAHTSGKTTALGLQWTAGSVGKAHEITTDARCKAPPSTPFDADRDSLFEDPE